MFKRYYEDELEYLRALGLEFSQQFPEIAGELGLGARDPDVERLLQGVAFLTARIRQEQEAHFPALLHPLLELLWPQALRPTPAIGVVQFKPRAGVLQEPVEVPRHARIQSVPVDGTHCQFRTAWPLAVLPLSLESLSLSTPAPGRARLQLDLKALPNLRQTGLNRYPLSFSLAGSPRQRFGLLLLLTRDLCAIHLRGRDARGQVLFTHALPPSCLEQLGWRLEDALLPQPESSFRGLRHLHEHFLFPGRSLHFTLNLKGTPTTPGPAASALASLQGLEVIFEGLLPDKDPLVIGRECVDLFTVPVVNLFTQSARPVALEAERTEYRLQGEQETPEHGLLYRVLSASALHPTRGQSVPVQPFMSHRRPYRPSPQAPVSPSATPLEPGEGGASNPALLFQLQLRPTATRQPSRSANEGEDRRTEDRRGEGSLVQVGVTPWLSFVTTDGTPPPPGLVISMDLEATNGALPSQLRQGDLSTTSLELPSSVTFQNIGAFSPAWPSLVGQGDLWRYVMHATLRHQLLSSRKALVTFLALHHIPAMFDERSRRQLEQLLGSIREVESGLEQVLAGDPPGLLRGTHVIVRIHEGRFVHPGELYLFGLTLSHLFGELAALNTFTRLTFLGEDHGTEIHYPRRSGRQALL